VRVALRTQQVIAHESGVTNTADPLGGAYFVEKLTSEIEAEAYDYFQRIDELGGMVEAVKTGFPQREIAEAAFIYQREVDTKQRIVVGVNDFRLEDEAGMELHRADPAAEGRQRKRLETTKAARDQGQVDAALARLREAATANENLMAPLIEATRVRASEGEMVAAMQDVFGTYTEHPQF
jgi:methylmalonyl-CoA mutase, N-terminal domain